MDFWWIIDGLFLMETFCLPILSYSCEAVCYNKQQLSQLKYMLE